MKTSPLALIFLGATTLISAVISPAYGQEMPRNQPPALNLPANPPQRELPSLQTPSSPPTSPTLSREQEVTVTIEQFDFQGNSALSDIKLNELVADYLQRPLAFAELLTVERIITQEYTQAGYINSGAVIPADQSFSATGGVVEIQVLEGKIEEVIVTGTERLPKQYVRDRVARATQAPFNQRDLLEALQLLQLNPLIATVSAELSAGVSPQASILEVTIKEADSFEAQLLTNNGRSPSVGSWRRGITLNHGNFLGFGDRATLAYTNTDGSDSLDGSYTLPLNARKGTLTIAGGFNETEVVEPPFDQLDIIGDSRYLDLSLRQPLVLKPTEEFALGVATSWQRSETELLGEDFPLSRGADDDGITKISAIRFFQDWTKRQPRQVIALRSQFSVGIDAFEATINEDDIPDSRFLAWRGQGQYVRLLAPDTLFVFRSDLQLAGDELVPLEQFGVGGFGSVRGYRQDTLLTDSAFFASAEVRVPILRVRNVDGVLQLVPFIDFGVGWNNGDFPDPDPNSLVGLGLGLNWQMGNRFNARLDWGIPLTDFDQPDRTLQEDGVYFSVNYNPF